MIGSNKTRVDSAPKMDGTLRYTADITYPDMLHAAVVRAPLAHGRIRAIRRGEGVDWSRVTFATAEDIPGNRFVQMITADMPFLAFDEVLYRGEPVALVAAPTAREAEAAAAAVTVEMDPLPTILTLEELVLRHRVGAAGDLVELSRWKIDSRGDVPAALAQADVVLEDCYTTPHQEHAYLEPNAMMAVPESDGRMRVEGSLQCPYYVAPAVAGMLATDLDHLHVRALPMGGAFGGKEDFPSLMGGHVALLAQMTGKPVRMLLSRAEDMAYTTKRHPSWVRVRAGAKKDGTLCGVELDIVFDGGAYISMSPVVLSRGAIHAGGAYNWPAVLVNAVAYRTHTPPNGAFRGFGVPQTIYAIESHMDRMAQACGMEPDAFRYKNRLRLGDVTGTSQTLRESVGSKEVLDAALQASDFSRKRAELGQANADANKARGIGMAYYWHGAGFTGGGEAKISAIVALDLRADGKAHVRVSSTEMGQGSSTALSQIVADHAGLRLDQVKVVPADTALVPNSGPTVASRTTMIVGGELAVCARAAKKKLLEHVAATTDHAAADLALASGKITAGAKPVATCEEVLAAGLAASEEERWVFTSQHKLAPHIQWDEETHTGDAYACYAWGCTVAEVEVDLDTYEVQVPRVTTACDVGKAVNPVQAKGQIEGGTLQSLGYALCEEVGVTEEGSLLRDRFQTYIVPTTLDAPELTTHIVEIPYSRGPGGAKGLGEMPMNGGAPAVANALAHALGARVRDLPLTPEKIWAAANNTDEEGA